MLTNSNKNTIKLTIFYNRQFWIGIFENTIDQNYTVAQHIFGAEPSDAVLYDFLLKFGNSLKYTKPQNNIATKEIKENPKRRLRRAKKEICQKVFATKAQQALKTEHEQQKIIIKQNRKLKKIEKAENKFILQQEKRKKKHRGH